MLRHKRLDPFSELSVSGSSDSEDTESEHVPPVKKQATGKAGGTVPTSSSSGNPAKSSSKTTRTSASASASASTSAATKASDGAWVKKWQELGYPKALLRELSKFRNNTAPNTVGTIAGLGNIPIPNAVRKAMATASSGGGGGGGSGSKAGSRPVYLVTYIRHGQYVDFSHKVLGTYSNVAAANDHVLAYTASYYGTSLVLGMKDWKRSRDADEFDLGVVWNVNADGCLSIVLGEEDGTQKIDCILQDVRDTAPNLESLENRNLSDDDTDDMVMGPW